MLQSLERQSGLPIALDPTTNTIRWTEGIHAGETKERTFQEMQSFIAEPGATSPREGIYMMYRDVGRDPDRIDIKSVGLRYDITVIAPGTFQGSRHEYFRTAGHYHSLVPGTNVAYPEVYEVIAGRVCWILQRRTHDDPEHIEEMYAIEAGPGEKAIMLPGFGHISVNPFPETLVMADWNACACVSDYAPYQKHRGGGYLVFEGSKLNTIEFTANHSYGALPELKKIAPCEVPEFGFFRSQPLYSLAHDLAKLDFLLKPEKYSDSLTAEHCYRAR